MFKIVIYIYLFAQFTVYGYWIWFSDFARKAKKIMIDIDNNELKNFSRMKPDQTLNCDANYFLKKFLLYLPKKIGLSNQWIEYCKNIRKKYPIVLDEFKTQKILKFIFFY